MSRLADLLITAIAPAVWGTTYLVTTTLLVDWYPLTIAALRALPAGLILLLLVRELPRGVWWVRTFILGALNFSIFWGLLFVAAQRLPGGVAAVVGAVQPLLVLLLAQPVLGTAIRPLAVLAAIVGMGGVALLVLSPEAGLDPWGIAAGLAGAVSMATGTVLSRRWQPAVPPLTITAWQLAAGGLLLVPVTLVFAPFPMAVSAANLLGLGWLGLVGGALTYIVWFRGIGRVGPAAATSLGLLSPATAVLLGLVVQGETLSLMQAVGLLALVGSIVVSQWTLAEPGSSAPGVRHPAAVDDSSGSASVAIRKST